MDLLGTQAAVLELESLAGTGKVSNAQFADAPYLLIFADPTCSACETLYPHLLRASQVQGVKVLFIASGDRQAIFVTAECPYCQKLKKKLEAFALNADHQLVFICTGEEGARKIRETYSFTYPVLIDSAGTVSQAYKTPGVPAVYQIDTAWWGGRRLGSLSGVLADPSLAKALEAICSITPTAQKGGAITCS